jgi:hypothetical protein
MSAQKYWRCLNRPERLGELIQGAGIIHGIKRIGRLTMTEDNF